MWVRGEGDIVRRGVEVRGVWQMSQRGMQMRWLLRHLHPLDVKARNCWKPVQKTATATLGGKAVRCSPLPCMCRVMR